MGEVFKTACTRIEGRPTGPLVEDLGLNLLLPSSWSFPPRIREGVAAERNGSAACKVVRECTSTRAKDARHNRPRQGSKRSEE
jgi:hypothetical protein